MLTNPRILWRKLLPVWLALAVLGPGWLLLAGGPAGSLAAPPPQPAAGPVGALQAAAALTPTVANLDVALVFDLSNSMELDTICYDCWIRCDQLPGGMNCAGPPTYNKYSDYPKNGKALPYDYYSDRMSGLRQGDAVPQRLTTPEAGGDGKKPYIIIEAEFYTNNTSTWDPAVRPVGTGYWALQRRLGGEGYSIDGTGYPGATDNRSGFVRHHPYVATEGNRGELPYGRHYTLDDARGLTSFPAPRLDYDFWPQWETISATTYIHLRVQAFAKVDFGTSPPFDEFFWAVDDGLAQQALPLGGVTNKSDIKISNDWRMPTLPSTRWHWVQLDAGVLSPDLHTLRIWAGSTGFAIDRIIITSEATLYGEIEQHVATPGSAQGLARDRCNPIFGLTVTAADCTSGYISLPAGLTVNNLDDPLFGDWQPYRGASEAIERFVRRLNPATDQAGLVTFGTQSTQRAQLECRQAAPARQARGAQINGYPALVPGVEYDETACVENALAGTAPISYHNVLVQLEQVRDGSSLQGATNIAGGLRRGLHLLGVDTDDDPATRTHTNDCNWTTTGTYWRIDGQTQPYENVRSHCGRERAAVPVIVLLTDGVPTRADDLDSACTIWSDTHPLPYPEFEPVKDDPKYECIMYYADIAATHNIPICAIGLTNSANPDLLAAVAARTGGKFYAAPSYPHLDLTFETLLSDCIGRLGADLALGLAQPVAGTVEAGAGIGYTLALTNIGPLSPVTATLVHTWNPPAAVSGAVAPGCQVDLAAGAITCLRPNLAAGRVQPELTLTLTTHPAFSGTFVASTTITLPAGLTDPWPDNNGTGPLATRVVRQPAITISDPSHAPHAWPANSQVTVQVSGHISGSQYPVYFGGGPMPAAGGGDCRITAGADGSGNAGCVVPAGLAAGGYVLSTTLTSQVLTVTTAGLAVTGGPAWTDNITVSVALQQHAPGHAYHLYFGRASGFVELPGSPVTADGNGAGSLALYIPAGYSGTYTLQSQDAAVPPPPTVTRRIAAATLTVVKSPGRVYLPLLLKE